MASRRVALFVVLVLASSGASALAHVPDGDFDAYLAALEQQIAQKVTHVKQIAKQSPHDAECTIETCSTCPGDESPDWGDKDWRCCYPDGWCTPCGQGRCDVGDSVERFMGHGTYCNTLASADEDMCGDGMTCMCAAHPRLGQGFCELNSVVESACCKWNERYCDLTERR